MANEIDEYMKAAESWSDDKRQFELKEIKTAKLLAGIFGAAFLATLTAMVVVIVNQKPPENVLFEVDKSTGIVSKVNLIAEGKLTYGDKTDRAYLWNYLTYREEFSMAYGEQFYNNVGLMSSAQEQERYSKYMSKDNPNSPINVYGPTNSQVRIHLKNFSKINDKTYLIRYQKEVISPGRGTTFSDWVATIVYSYYSKDEESEGHLNKPAQVVLTESQSLVNPLVMVVSEYHNNPETAGVK